MLSRLVFRVRPVAHPHIIPSPCRNIHLTPQIFLPRRILPRRTLPSNNIAGTTTTSTETPERFARIRRVLYLLRIYDRYRRPIIGVFITVPGGLIA